MLNKKELKTRKMYAITEDEARALEAMLSYFSCHNKNLNVAQDEYINYVLEPVVKNIYNVYIGDGTKDLGIYTEEFEKYNY